MRDIKDISLYMLDMDGTIYLGNRLFACTLPFLDCLKRQGKRFLFLTNNSSKNRYVYVEKLAKMGIFVQPDDVFTSGEATTIYMRKHFPGKRLCVIGMPSLQEEFREAGFTLDDEHPEALVLGFDLYLDYEKLTRLCNLVRSGIPYICTHPDYNCPVENGFIPDIGATIAYVQAAAGRMPDEIVGKPNMGMAQAVTEKYGVKADDVAMVGDRLYTDIAFGTNTGIASILVYSGETTREDYAASDIRADFVFDDLSGIQKALEADR